MRAKIAAFAILLIAALLLPASVGRAAGVVGVAGSIGELQSINGATNPVVQLLSYHAGLNRGGGLFVWDGAASGAPDNCVTFAAAGGQKGTWTRRMSGPLDPTMCGAYWDGSHDDAAVLSHAFAVAAARRVSLSLPSGTAKVCSAVTAVRAVIVRGQGMGTYNDGGLGPTVVDGSCMKEGWVFDIATPNGSLELEAPKYYDMEIHAPSGSPDSGCIRWNRIAGGFTDSAATQYYMMHPHAERIYCSMSIRVGIGFQCSKCFDGDFSQNQFTYGKTGIDLEGSDVMCVGCAGPNRIISTSDYLIRMVSHGTFGNMDRIVGNELLSPYGTPPVYDSFIYDNARSSTIESNHIEGVVSGVKSAIHVVGGFSHTIDNNDIDVLTRPSGDAAAPHWLIAEGPFTNFRAFNNGCAGCVMGAALFTNKSADFNPGFVRQVITHGGNAGNGDAGFPFNSKAPD